MAQQLRAQGQTVGLLVVMDIAILEMFGAGAWATLAHTVISRFGALVWLGPGEQADYYARMRKHWRQFLKCMTSLTYLESGEWVKVVQVKARLGIKRLSRILERGRVSARNQAGIALPHRGAPGQQPRHDPDEIASRHAWAVMEYVPKPHSGRLTLFWSHAWLRKGARRYPHDPTMGLHRVAKDVEVYVIPGEHLTSIAAYGDVLAARLKACLSEAQAPG
jgi:hypothetical protein